MLQDRFARIARALQGIGWKASAHAGQCPTTQKRGDRIGANALVSGRAVCDAFARRPLAVVPRRIVAVSRYRLAVNLGPRKDGPHAGAALICNVSINSFFMVVSSVGWSARPMDRTRGERLALNRFWSPGKRHLACYQRARRPKEVDPLEHPRCRTAQPICTLRCRGRGRVRRKPTR